MLGSIVFQLMFFTAFFPLYEIPWLGEHGYVFNQPGSVNGNPVPGCFVMDKDCLFKTYWDLVLSFLLRNPVANSLKFVFDFDTF